jgi:hypothetical protein
MQIASRKSSEARPLFQTLVETRPDQAPKDAVHRAADRPRNCEMETALMIESVAADIGVGA